MAGAGYKSWVDGDVLSAADVNTYLMEQAVMVFADSSARTTALPTPAEGMVTYLKDTNNVEVYNGSSWSAIAPASVGKVLQVVSTTLDTTVTITTENDAGTRYADVTGLSASITPSAATSKVLVTFSINGQAANYNAWAARVTRDGTAIGIGASPSNRNAVGAAVYDSTSDGTNISNLCQTVLDSPASTSALTYQVEVSNLISNTVAQTVYVNRTLTDTDQAVFARTASTITLMEIGA